MKYTVHHYTAVIVSIEGVEANSMRAAMSESQGLAVRAAEKLFSNNTVGIEGIRSTQFADGLLGALVDIEGDEDYGQSRYFAEEDALTFEKDGTTARR